MILLFCCILFQSVYAQDDVLERDSLPVFIIQDREFASLVDDFIVNAQNFINNFPVTFHIDINLGNDVMSVGLNLKEHIRNSDSLILYKNTHIHQAFIWHQTILFFTNITSFAYAYNYDMLTGLIKRSPRKQEVYFKDTPPDFYEISEWGGSPLEGLTFSSFHEYDGTKWYHGIRFIDDDHRKE